jgi:hypothetical protein
MRCALLLLSLALAGAKCDRPPDPTTSSSEPQSSALPVFGDRFAPPPEEQRRAIAIAVGPATSCAVLEAGSVWCWGSDASGELGWDMPITFNEPSRVVPTRVEGVTGATAVAVTRGQGCAIVGEGAVRCWGASKQSDRLMGPPPKRVLARQVGTLRGVVQLALGQGFGCAVLADDSMQCWAGVAGETTPPTLVRGVTAVELSPMGSFDGPVCLRRRQGSVLCGERDPEGLPYGTPFRGLEAMRGGEGARDLDLQQRELCAVRDPGEVVCWTLDPKRKLTDLEPVVRAGPSDVVEVAGACTRSAAGAVRCPAKAARGPDDFLDAPRPPDIALDGIRALAASSHTCAIDAGGAVLCWGANGWGQLANGRHTAAGPAPIKW